MNRLKVLACVGVLLLAIAHAAHAQGITLTIDNNTSRNLRVTVYDLTANPAKPAIPAQVINGFASITVLVSADQSGHAHVRWTATTVDQDMQKCSQRDKADLSDGATVHVFASDGCGGNS
jgi:hypothetical protein